MWQYTDLLQVLKGEPSSSVFSTDETLISASAAPHCRGLRWRDMENGQTNHGLHDSASGDEVWEGQRHGSKMTIQSEKKTLTQHVREKKWF